MGADGADGACEARSGFASDSEGGQEGGDEALIGFAGDDGGHGVGGFLGGEAGA